MQMFFEASSTVTLLFEFWSVNGPGGMFLSVVVVLLLTVFYEFLKVWSMVLVKRFEPLLDTSVPATCTTPPCSDSPVLKHTESTSSLPNSPSQVSLAPTENTTTPGLGTSTVERLLLHGVRTLLHIVQVVLGYMLMLCVMSYNVWIFLGVIVGSLLGYFIAYPLLGRYML
ncbi:protein SLC31A2 [Clarias gariepinus]|uniref:probable low affinity copper uptake protein 2 n=1 Tax=Clarias gariepinus TaxID=13013 RepID=UPI00234C0E1D|nr:probable low affinity copper uptake protein 2 [Clarias gariepinus]